MPIQNIQGLVDKNGLSYINNGNFINQYYNEALANLGQRNTNDSLLESITFTINEIFSKLNVYVGTAENPIPNDLYLYVIYHNANHNGDVGTFYTLNKSKIDNIYGISDYNVIDINDLQDIISIIQSHDIKYLEDNEYIKELVLSNDTNNSSDNSYIILNKQLNIIAELFDYINNPKDKDGNPLKDKTGMDIHPIKSNKIFIPLNYQFGYIANGVNKSIIYHSFKDIYVNVIPEGFNNTEDDYELESLDFYNTNIFYCAEQSFIKTDVYEYVFVVKNENEQVECSYKCTLPYVNSDDYWVINNQETSIQAKAHDAVNLNIILAYYYKNGNDNVTYKYLSGLNNNFNIDQIGYSDNFDFKIQNGEDIILCNIRTPNISKNNLTKNDIKLKTILENSTLIIISKITDIIVEGKNLEKYGNGYVTTMWHYVYNEENDNQENINGHFECICINNDIALDFNQLTNFENLIKYEIQHVSQITPDNYLYRHLVFDQIYQQLKQDNKQLLYSYPVLQNIKGSQYNNKYNNNMNFSLKYINYISGEIGKDIKGVSKGSDTKYLKNNTSTSNTTNVVTNTLYQYVTRNKINYYNEYIPNYNVPLFDLSEVLIKDFNVLNKTNIITFDNDGQMYYSYIGTSHQTNKNILTIGSYSLNINLGENTLTDYNTKNSFKIQDTLNINFSYINTNGDLTVANDIEVGGNLILNKFDWNKSEINGIEIQSTSFIPQFKYYIFDNILADNQRISNMYKIINIDSLEGDIRQLSTLASNMKLDYGSDAAKQYLYISPIIAVKNSAENQMPYYYKYNDLLVLPNLVKYLGFNYTSDVNFESNTNDIIVVGGKQLYLVSSNSVLSESISIVSSTDTGVTIDTLNSKDFYLGNTLFVTYIQSQNKFIVNEVQSNKIKSIWKIPTEI